MAKRTEHRDESYDLLHQYLQEIARIPRLTPERERELGRLAQKEDKTAIEELVKANLRFVVSYAKKFRNSHVLFLDLINEGNIGLIQAAKKFDPDKNVKFITYAVWWIRQSILHALSEQGSTFRLPPKQANLLYRLERAMTRILTEENRMPSTQELADELDVPKRDVETLLRVSNDSFSLSAEIDPESHTELEDMIEQTMMDSVEDVMQREAAREELMKKMEILSPRERLVLTLRHGISDGRPKRMVEIADFLGRDLDEIRAILCHAEAAVRDLVAVDRSELSHLLIYSNPHPQASWNYWVSLGDLSEDEFGAVLAERAEYLEDLRHSARIQMEVDKLPLHQRVVLKLRYGILQEEELTLRDIGELLGLSRERVRQIESRAEAKCRRGVKRK